ncbi:MAG: hypothetical protein R3C61_06390 [Bacteroidia bacterium]
MLRKLDSLIPSFLRQIDRQLLLNRPGLWATRIHYILYFLMIGCGILFFSGLTRTISLNDVPNPDINTLILIIPAGIAFLIWAYNVSLFQVEKSFGMLKESKMRDQLISAVVILLLGFLPLIYGYMINFRIKQQITEEELIHDLNALNIGENLFITDRYYTEPEVNPKVYIEGEIPNIGYSRYSHYTYYPEALTRDAEISEILRYRLKSESERLDVINRYIIAFNKYTSTPITLSAEEILYRFETRDFQDSRQTRYDEAKDEVTTNIERVQRAWAGKFEILNKDFAHFYFFGLMIIWMALQVFLKTDWKLFAGSAVAGIVSIILIAITYNTFQYLFNLYDDGFAGLIILAFFGFFTYQAFRRRHTDRVIAWKSISLSVVSMTTLLLPLVITTSVDSSINDREAISLLYTGAIIGFIMWNTIYQPRFSRLAALPREN